MNLAVASKSNAPLSLPPDARQQHSNDAAAPQQANRQESLPVALSKLPDLANCTASPASVLGSGAGRLLKRSVEEDFDSDVQRSGTELPHKRPRGMDASGESSGITWGLVPPPVPPSPVSCQTKSDLGESDVLSNAKDVHTCVAADKDVHDGADASLDDLWAADLDLTRTVPDPDQRDQALVLSTDGVAACDEGAESDSGDEEAAIGIDDLWGALVTSQALEQVLVNDAAGQGSAGAGSSGKEQIGNTGTNLTPQQGSESAEQRGPRVRDQEASSSDDDTRLDAMWLVSYSEASKHRTEDKKCDTPPEPQGASTSDSAPKLNKVMLGCFGPITLFFIVEINQIHGELMYRLYHCCPPTLARTPASIYVW